MNREVRRIMMELGQKAGAANDMDFIRMMSGQPDYIIQDPEISESDFTLIIIATLFVRIKELEARIIQLERGN